MKMAIKQYPKYLLPRVEWHRIPPHHKMKRLMVIRLMRKMAMPSDGVITRDIMTKAMRENEFYHGMSVNLLFRYKKKDTVWWIDDETLTADWDFKSKAPTFTSQQCKCIKKQGYFGFRIEDIEKLSSTYQIYDNKGKPQRTDEIRCKVVHSPNRVNFWHYNIYLYGEETLKDGGKRVYPLHEEVKEKKVKSVASEMMEDFFSIMKTRKKLHVHCMPKALYKRTQKWSKMKDRLIREGIITNHDMGY